MIKGLREDTEWIRRVTTGRTTIIIAYWFLTIINADIIYMMDRGRVIEQGNHEQLMIGDSVYKDLIYA